MGVYARRGMEGGAVRNWQVDAPNWIAATHAEMPGCTPAELRKALRAKAQSFHGGTSWGAKVWSKHCTRYIAALSGGQSKAKPIEWAADIHFPFRDHAPT